MASSLSPATKLSRVREKAQIPDRTSTQMAIERVTKEASKNGLEKIVEARVKSAAAEVDFIPDHSIDFGFAHGLPCFMENTTTP